MTCTPHLYEVHLLFAWSTLRKVSWKGPWCVPPGLYGVRFRFVSLMCIIGAFDMWPLKASWARVHKSNGALLHLGRPLSPLQTQGARSLMQKAMGIISMELTLANGSCKLNYQASSALNLGVGIPAWLILRQPHSGSLNPGLSCVSAQEHTCVSKLACAFVREKPGFLQPTFDHDKF